MAKWLFTFMLLIAGVANAQSVTDPTRPQTYAGQSETASSSNRQETKINLSAVFVTDKSRYAVINDQTVSVGESFRDFTVVEIHSNSVILQSAGIRKEILINNQSIKKDASNDF